MGKIFKLNWSNKFKIDNYEHSHPDMQNAYGWYNSKKSLKTHWLPVIHFYSIFYTLLYIVSSNTDDHYSNIYKLKRHIVSIRVQKKGKKMIVENK